MTIQKQWKRIKPQALRQGDTIGVVAPASSFKREEFDAGCDVLRNMGYKVVYDESIFDRDLYFAGSADRRTRELESMFDRDDVKAIVCARGGYGANYLLPAIDIQKIARNPKILVGYSDVTSLLTFLTDKARVVTFHGPMVAKDFARPDGVDRKSWQQALGGAEGWQLSFDQSSGVQALAQGSAEGLLYGGCLSMLVASLGTPYEIQTEGTILFLEDVATKPYQIDRMLMQLKLAGKLTGVRGIIFGEMLGCDQGPDNRMLLKEIVKRVIGELEVPTAYGVRSGHVLRENITLPIGVNAVLEVADASVSLEITEAATRA